MELQQINVDAIRPELDTLDERREFKRQRKLQQIADEIEMKFSHSIQFNAVPEWSSNYLSYSNLKKLIYALEKEANHSQRSAAPDDTEGASLLGEAHSDPDAVLRRVLDIDLDKICTFYQSKEREIYAEVDIFLEDEEEHEVEGGVDGANGVHAPPGSQGSVNGRTRHGSLFKSFPGFSRKRRNSTFAESIEEGDEADSDADDDETAALQPKLSPVKSRSKTWDAHTGQSIEDLRSPRDFPRLKRRVSESFDEFGEGSMLLDSIINLKKRAVHVYVSLCELKSFAQLNKTGFAKVLKKYDKTLDRKLKTSYLEQQVQTAYPFLQSTAQELDNRISTVVSAFSRFMTEGDISEAERELRLHLREHVVWERNTVWREMIGIERKAQAAKMGVSRTMFGGHRDNRDTRLTGDAEEGPSKELRTPLGRYRCPRWLLSWNIVVLVGIFAVFIILVNSRMLDSVEQRNCLAMLVFVSLLWAFEVSANAFYVITCFLADDLHTGHSSVRHLSPHPLLGRRPARCAIRRRASSSP